MQWTSSQPHPKPLGISFSDCQRITTVPVPSSEFVATITILEVPVRRIQLDTEFLLSYEPLRAGAFSRRSRIGKMLVPYGSVIPGAYKGEVYWLPPLRKQTPVPRNTYCEREHLTIWHYLALGLFPPYLMDAFLDGACAAGNAEVHRDLWEFCGDDPSLSVYSPLPEERTDSISCWLTRLPEEDQKKILRYRSPLELCLMVGEPLFSKYDLKKPAAELPRPIQEMIRWSESLTRSRRLMGRNGLG